MPDGDIVSNIRTAPSASGNIEAAMMWNKQLDQVRRAALCEEQDGLCFYCAEPMTLPPFTKPRRLDGVTLDHLIPVSEGGHRRVPNEVAACNGCNNARGTTPWLLFYCLKELERQDPAASPVIAGANA